MSSGQPTVLEFVTIGALLPLFAAILGAPSQETAVDALIRRFGIHPSDPESLARRGYGDHED